MVLSIVCFVLLFFLGIDSSPLYGEYFHHDASIYYVMGRSLLEGFLPYTDYFDNKGIILYFLYAIGIAFNGSRIGLFLLEGISMLFSSLLLIEMMKQFHLPRRKYIFPLSVFFLFYFCLSEGPLTENFSLPMQLLSLFMYISHDRDKEERRYYIYGVCLAFIFFIRPNNICITLAVVLCEQFGQFGMKERLWRATKIFIGFIFISAPIVMFMCINGCLSDMINAAVLTNIKYRFDLYDTDKAQYICNILRIATVGVFATVISVVDKKKRVTLLAIVYTLIITIVYGTGRSYKHYFMIMIPLLVIGFILLMKQISHSRRILIPLIFLPLIAYNDIIWSGSLRCAGKLSIELLHYPPPLRIVKAQKEEDAIIKTLEMTIPYNERNNIYVHDCSDMLWVFQYFKTIPKNKYSTVYIVGLERYKKDLKMEMKMEFSQIIPRWIIAKKDEIIELPLKAEYNYVTNVAENICLYKRKEPK